MITDSILIAHSYEHGWDSVRSVIPRLAGGYLPPEVTNSADIAQAVSQLRPKAILASSMLSGESSYPFVRGIRETSPSTVLISVFSGGLTPYEIHQFAQLNLSGFFQWNQLLTSDSVHTAVRTALSADIICGTRWIVGTYFRHQRLGAQDQAWPPTPTGRQQQILRLLVSGYSQDGIAYELGYGKRTIARELDALKERLEAENTHELVMRATIFGFLP